METISIGRPDAARRLASLLPRLISRLLVPVELWLDWTARYNQRRALALLDDRMLRDIGLTRGDAEFEIAKPIWRL